MLPPRARRAFRLAARGEARVDEEVDDELRLHVELRVEQLVAAGWSREDAEAEARRRFGASWGDAVATLRQARHTREERLAMRERLDALMHDLRYALRGLRRAPRFTISALLTLALGLGATTVIYSIVDHVVLRPLAYRDVDRLVVVREVIEEMRDVYPTMPANASHYLEWRRACTVCESVGAARRLSVTLGGTGDPQRVGLARVSANLLPLLGVHPAQGRTFREEEEERGRDAVVILSDAFWRRQFGADPRILGRTITLGDREHTVVGVLPPRAGLPKGSELGWSNREQGEIDVYKPLALIPRERTTPGEYDYAAIARLKPGVSVEAARAHFDALQRGVAERAPQKITLRAQVTPLQAQVVGTAQRPLLLLLGAVGAVLLIVCVNLASLSLARDAGRHRESAVRVALGAGRGRLAGLAIAESLLLALAGGAVGLLLSYWGLQALVATAPASLPRVEDVRLDGRIFAAAGVIALLVGLSFGALPALRRSRAQPGAVLRSAGGRGATEGRAGARRRAGFIAAQVALSTILLVGTGLFLTSFVRVLRGDKGFAADRVLALDVAVPLAKYPDGAARTAVLERAMRELAAIPGVTASAITTAVPLEGDANVDLLSHENDARPAVERPTVSIRYVSPSYFGTVGTTVKRGRAFTDADRGTPVVLLSERAARALWPNEDAIGKRMVPGSNDPTAEVIGLVNDVRTASLEKEGAVTAYLPYWNRGPAEATMLLRSSLDPASLTASARGALRRVDPSVPVAKVRTMEQVVSAAVAVRRFQLALLALFAAMALVAASVGIYGVISQSLASRTREIGVRMSLGAAASDVHRLVLREGLAPVGVGLAIGVAASFAAARAASSLLFEVAPADPVTILVVAALLAAVGAVACLVPARRATSNDLVTMLRTE